jgi:FkbM family methyltransferase
MIRLAKSLLRKCGFEMHRVANASMLPSQILTPTCSSGHETVLGSSPGSAWGDAFDTQQKLFEALGRNETTVFDIGANVGRTAHQYRLRFPNSNIYCFEPFPDCLQKLEERFGADASMKIVPMAVADKPGTRQFYVNELPSTNSLLPRPTEARRYYPAKDYTKGIIEVNVTTIDEFVREGKVAKPDILKIDIQGGELMALKGAVQTLREQSVSLIFTEVMFVPHYEGGPLFYETWGFLNDFDYTLFDIFNVVRATNGQLRQADALFVSSEVRSQVIDTFDQEQ